MKQILLITFSIFICSLAFGQFEYREGIIIKNDGDTLVGLIKVRNAKTNATTCSFKESGTNQEVDYSATNLREYIFQDGTHYVSKITPDSLNTIFLEMIVEGRLSLYYSDFDGKEAFYISKEGMPLSLLPNNSTTIEKYGKEYTQESRQHIGILKYYTSDYPELITRNQDITFNYTNLVRFVEKYNKHFSTSETPQKGTRKAINADLELIGGSSKLFMANQSSMVYGFYLHLFQSKLSGNLNLKIGFNYRKYELINSHLDLFTSTEHENTDNKPEISHYQYQMLSYPILLEYRYKRDKIEPFIGLGINTVFFLIDEYTTRNKYDDLENYTVFHLGTNINITSKIKARAYYELNFKTKLKSVEFNGLDQGFQVGLYYTF